MESVPKKKGSHHTLSCLTARVMIDQYITPVDLNITPVSKQKTTPVSSLNITQVSLNNAPVSLFIRFALNDGNGNTIKSLQSAVYSLYFTLSLRFTSGLKSSFYTGRYTNQLYQLFTLPLKTKEQMKIILWYLLEEQMKELPANPAIIITGLNNESLRISLRIVSSPLLTTGPKHHGLRWRLQPGDHK